jgi:hypothetical protein
MIVLEVLKNGKTLCRAGRRNLAVLDAIITYVEPKARRRARRLGRKRAEIQLHVGGMTARANGDTSHPRWFSGPIAVGDDIIVRIRRARRADRPSREKSYTARDVRTQQRNYYEAMKRKFERR